MSPGGYEIFNKKLAFSPIKTKYQFIIIFFIFFTKEKNKQKNEHEYIRKN